MRDYKPVRSSLDISKSVAFYLEMSDPAAFRQGDRAGSIRAVNDILQGRSKRTVGELLKELERKCGTHYAAEITAIQLEIRDFLGQKELLSQVYNKSCNSRAYHFKTYQNRNGRPLKIVDQNLFDKAAEQGFMPQYERNTEELKGILQDVLRR